MSVHQPQTEQVANAVISTLKAALPGKLEGLRSFWADHDTAAGLHIPLDAPLDRSYYFGDTAQIDNFPAIVVDPEKTQPQRGGPVDRDGGMHPEVHRLMLELYLVDDSDEETSRAMVRYGTAVAEVLEEDSALGDLVKAGVVGERDYGRGATESAIFRVVQIPLAYWALADD